jgi:hypothetical protein
LYQRKTNKAVRRATPTDTVEAITTIVLEDLWGVSSGAGGGREGSVASGVGEALWAEDVAVTTSMV